MTKEITILLFFMVFFVGFVPSLRTLWLKKIDKTRPMFTQAIVRRPCPAIVDGLTTSNLGKPFYQLALQQHIQYVNALMACGLKVNILDPDNNYPDSTFVKDTALLIPNCAIITNPGAPSRKGETEEMATLLERFFQNMESIEPPGTVDAGDIMMKVMRLIVSG